MVEKGQIPLKVALEAGDFPNASKIIALLDQYERKQQEQQAQMQLPQGIVQPNIG
jgi:hypothetical protein